MSTLRRSCPSLQQLSLMNNEAAPSYFNGGSYTQYKDYRYDSTSAAGHTRVWARNLRRQSCSLRNATKCNFRHFVISQLKNLEVLDDTRISREERGEAERIYAQHLPHVPTTFTPTRKVYAGTGPGCGEVGVGTKWGPASLPSQMHSAQKLCFRLVQVEFEFGIAPQDTPDLQIHNQAFSNFKSP